MRLQLHELRLLLRGQRLLLHLKLLEYNIAAAAIKVPVDTSMDKRAGITC